MDNLNEQLLEEANEYYELKGKNSASDNV